jgi:hypothetical protein
MQLHSKKIKIIRGTLRFFNEIFLLIKKKKITLKFLEFLLKKNGELHL